MRYFLYPFCPLHLPLKKKSQQVYVKLNGKFVYKALKSNVEISLPFFSGISNYPKPIVNFVKGALRMKAANLDKSDFK